MSLHLYDLEEAGELSGSPVGLGVCLVCGDDGEVVLGGGIGSPVVPAEVGGDVMGYGL